MKKWVALLLGAVMLLSLAACSNKPPKTKPDAETKKGSTTFDEKNTPPKTIGISVLYRRDEYYTDLVNSLSKYASEYGYKVEIMDADLDAAVQQQQLEDFVTQGVDLIALSPIDPEGLASVCNTIGESGIPVVIFDGKVESDAVISNVVFDNLTNGRELGKWTKKYIEENFDADETVKVAILDFPASSTVSVPIANGFAEIMNEIPNVEIVARQDGTAMRTKCMAITENILTANPDLDIVMGINFDSGAGARAAIEAAGSHAVVVSAGWAQEGFEQLAANDPILKVLCVNQPALQGEDTMKTIDAYFKGESVPKDVLSTPKLVDASTVDDFGWEKVVAMRDK